MVRSGKRSVPFEVVLAELERQAPLALAEAWDNVGLLIAPSRQDSIASLGLTIDLTDAVLAEFRARGVDFVVAYHPPIFEPLKRLSAGDAKSRIAVAALEAGIAVYSPHTALDSAPGGVNDWLIEGFGDGLKRALQLPRARIALESSEEDQPRVGQGRGLVLDDPQPIGVLIGQLRRRLGLQRLRVARLPDPERQDQQPERQHPDERALVLLGQRRERRALGVIADAPDGVGILRDRVLFR